MAGPTNGIIGEDAGYGLDLPGPETKLGLDPEVANMGRFSKTKEFQALKKKIESRIEYFRSYQPGGGGQDMALRDMPNSERGWRTLAADIIISEFNALIAAYELAAQEVKDESARQKNPS